MPGISSAEQSRTQSRGSARVGWAECGSPTYPPHDMRYRRAQVPGGTYFFTVALAERKSTLLIEQADGFCM